MPMRSVIIAFTVLLAAPGCSSRETPRDRTDAGVDSGSSLDAARLDAGSPDDGGHVDAGAVEDAGRVDSGDATDAGRVDGGPIDGGPRDAGRADAAGRTIATGHCYRTFGSCGNDLDCSPGGCGGESCASEDIFTTCDCTRPTDATCGCVAGMCAWYR